MGQSLPYQGTKFDESLMRLPWVLVANKILSIPKILFWLIKNDIDLLIKDIATLRKEYR